MSEHKVIWDGRLKPFSPRYCSLPPCHNKPMREEIIGRTMYRTCPHYTFYVELTDNELRRKQERVA